MKKLFIVQYNDCYGNGDSSIEVIVKSKEDFNRWLKQHNEERESDGELEESEEEFTLIPVELFS